MVSSLEWAGRHKHVLGIVFFNALVAFFLLSSSFSLLDLVFAYLAQSLILSLFFIIKGFLSGESKISVLVFLSALLLFHAMYFFVLYNLFYAPTGQWTLALNPNFVLAAAAVFFAMETLNLAIEARDGITEDEGIKAGHRLASIFFPMHLFILCVGYMALLNIPKLTGLLLIALKTATEIKFTQKTAKTR